MRVYFLLGLFLFFWVSLPISTVNQMRSVSVAALAPSWKWAKGVKRYLSDRPEQLWRSKKGSDSEEIKRLRLENRALRLQVEKASQWLGSEALLSQQIDFLKSLARDLPLTEEAHWRSFLQRKASRLRELLQWELMAIPGQVIYRDPAAWSSSIWVNVGEEDNQKLGSAVVAKNSPVVAGNTLVGVVDYVGKRHSRVRLVTDSGLSPSVRAVRGASQAREEARLANSLLNRLGARQDAAALKKELKGFLAAQGNGVEEAYLAKGEIHGSSAPFWRSRSASLQGVGFNFDYPDEEGAAQKGIPIIQEGDLLVTSGMDGVFPADLLVGTVSKVHPPKPGGYAYEIEALSSAPSLNDLETLFILPPVND